MHDTFDPVALARRQAVIGAALARGGAGLRSASLAIGVAAIGFGLVLLHVDPHRAAGVVGWLSLAQILFIGLGQFFGLRTAVDADLFDDLAHDPDLAVFDAAMAGLGLLPVDKQGRSMGERVAGLRRLLRLQGAGVMAQLLFLAALVAPGGLL